MQTGCDILIVGAGFVGVCVALQALAKNPDQSIILLDAGIAGGATVLHSSAMFLPFGASEEVRDMTTESAAFYQAHTGFSEDVWEAHPFYWVARPSEQAQLEERLLNSVASVAHDGQCPVAAQFPHFAPEDDSALFLDMSVYRARPSGLHALLLTKALGSGRVRLCEGVRVTKLEPGADGTIEVGTPFCDFHADQVVVCVAGAIQSPIFAPFFTAGTIRAKKIVSFFIPFDGFCGPPVGVGFMGDDVYVMPEPQKARWILSVTSNEWDVDILNERQDFTNDELETACCFANEKLGLDRARLLGASVYADSYSPEHRPRIIRPEGFNGGLTLAVGTSGYGLKVGPAVARAALGHDTGRLP